MELTERLRLRWNVHAVVRAPDGTVVWEWSGHNKTNNTALAAIAQWAAGTAANLFGSPLAPAPSQMQLGVGTGTAGRTDGASTATIPCGLFATSITPQTAPALSDGGAGGSLAAGTYYAVVTYTGATGETTPGPESLSITIPANHEIVVTPADTLPGGMAWSVYLTAANGGSGNEAYRAASGQTGVSDALGALGAGATPPAANTAVPTGALASLVSQDVYNLYTSQWTAFWTPPAGFSATEAVLLDPYSGCWAHVLLLPAPPQFDGVNTFTVTWQMTMGGN